MKSRIIWAVVLLATFVAFYLGTIEPAMHPAPAHNRPPIANRPTPYIPPSVLAKFDELVLPMPKIPPPPIVKIHLEPPALKLEIPIQNGAPLDFSLGTLRQRSQVADEDAVTRSLREMAENPKSNADRSK